MNFRAVRFETALLAATILAPAALGAADCDANQSEDAIDIAAGRVPDCNGNGVPDACDLAPASLAFVEPEETLLPAVPHFAAGGDLDGDGDRDAVVGVRSPGNPTGLLFVLERENEVFSPAGSFRLLGESFRGEAFFADLTGDSLLDVIVWFREAPLLQVLRNVDGVLAEAEAGVPIPFPVRCLAVADFDGNGMADLAAADQLTNRIVILDGARSFAPGQELPVQAIVTALAAGDLDRDGDPDLAAAANTPNGVFVFRNAAGVLSGPETVALGWTPSSLAPSDLDGDGHLDLYAGGHLVDDFAILRSTGGGVFTVAQEGRLPRSGRVLSADIEGDGDQDIVLPLSWTGCSGPGVSLLYNGGDGRLGARSFLPVADLQPGGFLDDLDGDARLDFVAARWRPDGNGGGPRGWLLAARSRVVEQSEDCNTNGIPDECDRREGDCDWNGVVDSCEILAGARADCDGDLRPDECGRDCNRNAVPDPCDIAAGTSTDEDATAIPDECEPSDRAGGRDCNGNDADDASELAAGTSADCNANGYLDECDLAIFRNQYGSSFPLDFPSGQGSLADLNGDGRDDLIVGSGIECCTFAEAFLVVFLSGSQAGAWHSSGRYTGIPRPGVIVPADVDGDGDLDLLAGNRDLGCHATGRIAVLRNQGHGALAAGPVLAFGRDVVSLAARDFDRDGRVDVAALEQGIPPSELLFFRGAGEGAFASWPAMVLPGLGLALASEDFDGDGDADVAVTTVKEDGSDARLLVHRNEAGDLSGLAQSLPVLGQPFALAAVGSAGDARRDLLVGSFGTVPSLALFRGGEGAVLLDPVFVPVDVTVDRVIAGDQDGDGDDDIAIAGAVFVPGTSPSSQVLTLFRNQAGTLLRSRRVLDDFWLTFLAGGDLDADGDRDFALADILTQRVIVLENRGQGRFGGDSRSRVDLGPVAVVAADFDRDGDQDLATANARSADLKVLSNEGQGVIGVADGIPLEFAPRSAVAADIDGDASPDLAAAGSFHLGWVLNQGDGAFAASVRRRIGSNPVAIQAADLDGDGALDLATANQLLSGFEDNVSVLLNDGQGSFLTPRNFAAGLGAADLVPADLDGDGDLELAVPNAASSEVTLLWSDGAGTFSRNVKIPVTDAGPVDQLLAVDVDGDRDLDLLAKSSWKRVVVLESLGSGEFAIPPLLDLAAEDWPLGSFEWSFEAADMDRDGDPDLIAASRGALCVSRGAAGRFALRPESQTWDSLPGGQGGSGDPSPPNRVAMVVADLDEDGDLDPAVSFELANAVVVFLNRLDEASRDRNGNGIPDSCEPNVSVAFRRGDADASGGLNISDPVVILRHLFAGGERLDCLKAADADDDGTLNVTDPIRILRHLFLGEPPLPEPFGACGYDGSADDLGCERFPLCTGE